MAANDKTAAWLGFWGAVIVAVIGGAVAIYTRSPADNGGGGSGNAGGGGGSSAGSPAVMGPLQSGINLQGMDFDAFGTQTANEQLCAELCRTTSSCKAMTYVVSRKTCWLKAGVPPSQSGLDFVSSIKQ
jgi:hypothetical protein